MRVTDAIAHPALRDDLAAAVREAGAIAASTFQTTLKSWTKGGGSPVSEADIAVDNFLRDRLMRLVPDCGWLSEETEDDRARLHARRLWIVDPIDGTRAYLSGRSDWAVSVALVEDGRPVAAALFAPIEDTFYLAFAGQGATINGKPSAATLGATLDGARVAGPKSVVERMSAVASITVEPRVHSLALRLARVAAGTLDLAIAGGNSHDWDLAAADLLVHEAGGSLTDFEGQSLVYNRAEPRHGALVAAGRARHETFIGLIRARALVFA